MSRINTIEQQLREALARAEAAEQERDEARRCVCERAAHGRPGHENSEDYASEHDAARDFGWGYLYPADKTMSRDELRGRKICGTFKESLG